MKIISPALLIISMMLAGVVFGETSVEQLKVKAIAGDFNSQAILGEIYRRGEIGVTKDYGEALKWLNIAASNNNPLAYYNLGCLYQNGKGVDM